MKENDIKGGVLIGATDSRDFPDLFGGSSDDFDWRQGFDVEDEIGQYLPINNQSGTYSCVGQAKSKDREVKETLDINEYKLYSAKSIYALRNIKPMEGMYLRDACNIEKNIGVCLRSDVPDSHVEAEMNDSSFAEEGFPITKSRAYFSPSIAGSIDLFAKAIRDYNGVIFAYDGLNNGKNFLENPVLPKHPNEIQWGHCTFAKAARLVDGEKRIYFVNSWGENCGVNGVQYLTESQIAPNENNYSPITWSLYGTLDEDTIINNLDTMTEQFIEDNKEEILLVQNVEGDGEVSVFMDGKLLKGTKEDVLLTYLILTEGTGIPQLIYDNLEIEQIKK